MQMRTIYYVLSIVVVAHFLVKKSIAEQDCMQQQLFYIGSNKITQIPQSQIDNQTKVVICFGDITQQKVDAIVNAANEQMLGGGGIDGAIHKAALVHVPPTAKEPWRAGKSFDELEIWAKRYLKIRNRGLLNNLCKQSAVRLPTGQAVVSPSFGLAQSGVKVIVHAVGPRGSQCNRAELLRSAYWNALTKAAQGEYLDKNGTLQKAPIKTIALPQLSVGIFGYPVDQAVQVAAQTIIDFIKQHPGTFEEVRLIMWTDKQGKQGYEEYVEYLLDRLSP